MQTIITLTVNHTRPILELGERIASRAWTIDGVECAEVQLERVIEWPVLPSVTELESFFKSIQ